MHSMLVIGLGDFGHHLSINLVKMKNEVLLVDKNEEAMDDLRDLACECLIADCTSRSALEKIGVRNFDICFVCIGSDFKSNLIIVTLLKELGAKYIVSQTDDTMLENLLLKNGANDVIHPNKSAATRAAVSYSSTHIFDYLKLRGGYSIYEITPLKEWVDKSIMESDIRAKYDTYIIGIIPQDGKTDIMPSPHAVIRSNDRLMILTHESTMEKFIKNKF